MDWSTLTPAERDALIAEKIMGRPAPIPPTWRPPTSWLTQWCGAAVWCQYGRVRKHQKATAATVPEAIGKAAVTYIDL